MRGKTSLTLLCILLELFTVGLTGAEQVSQKTIPEEFKEQARQEMKRLDGLAEKQEELPEFSDQDTINPGGGSGTNMIPAIGELYRGRARQVDNDDDDDEKEDNWLIETMGKLTGESDTEGDGEDDEDANPLLSKERLSLVDLFLAERERSRKASKKDDTSDQSEEDAEQVNILLVEGINDGADNVDADPLKTLEMEYKRQLVQNSEETGERDELGMPESDMSDPQASPMNEAFGQQMDGSVYGRNAFTSLNESLESFSHAATAEAPGIGGKSSARGLNDLIGGGSGLSGGGGDNPFIRHILSPKNSTASPFGKRSAVALSLENPIPEAAMSSLIPQLPTTPLAPVMMTVPVTQLPVLRDQPAPVLKVRDEIYFPRLDRF